MSQGKPVQAIANDRKKLGEILKMNFRDWDDSRLNRVLDAVFAEDQQTESRSKPAANVTVAEIKAMTPAAFKAFITAPPAPTAEDEHAAECRKLEYLVKKALEPLRESVKEVRGRVQTARVRSMTREELLQSIRG